MAIELDENGDIKALYRSFIHKSRYARWLPEEGRRETWEETVDRYISFFMRHVDGKYIPLEVWDELRKCITNHDVMPSMRAMMTAGPALERDHVAGYNCSYLAINRQRAFDELMYILLCGTGVGFSCERQEIQNLPVVAEEMHPTDTTIVVADSKVGWASAFRELISLLYSGKVPKWDLSKVRPAGAVLKTFGGRASGPNPLDELFRYSVSLFSAAVGRRLNSTEVHGLVCKIAEVVVVGGVRRSALISLSNLSDDRMRHAKSGQWWVDHPEYALANNSACYTEKPDAESFMREWLSLVESKSGERGIFNRQAAIKQVERNGRRDGAYLFGTNPCSEILLRDREFCNLTEVVVRSTDTFGDLERKVRHATILGTLQSTLTDFRYLSKKWKDNCEEERLLGVSLTGIMDHPVLNGSVNPAIFKYGFNDEPLHMNLERLKGVAIETNKEWAEKLGINPATAITCVKPSGTVSQLVDSASGIHTRFASYYLRTVRMDKKDPLSQFMADKGFYMEDCIGSESKTNVVYFPMKSPEGSVFTQDRSAIEQLEHWLIYQKYWTEHKPSITIYVKDEEWPEVGGWVYNHFDEVSGVSFLPHTDSVYKQAPYQEITEEEFNEWVEKMPKEVDWSDLAKYETSDQTAGSQELACVGGACEI